MTTQDILASAKRVFDIEAEELHRLSDLLTDDFAGAVRAILDCRGKVIVCGMGKSGHIGRKIAATLASTGTPSFFMHPAEAFHGDLGMITPDDIFVGISNSGETEEVIRLIPAVKRSGNKFIAICGRTDSTLARNADFFLNVHVTREACPLELAPTSSTTSTLAMGDALAVALMEARDFRPENFALFHPGGSLGRKLLTRVKDVMRTENLPVVSPDASFQDLILAMTDGKLGLAMVVEQGQLKGIVTDGDLRRAWQRYQDLSGKTIADLMTPSPRTIPSGTMLADAEQLLLQYKITSLIVQDDPQGPPVGVLQLYAI